MQGNFIRPQLLSLQDCRQAGMKLRIWLLELSRSIFCFPFKINLIQKSGVLNGKEKLRDLFFGLDYTRDWVILPHHGINGVFSKRGKWKKGGLRNNGWI